MPAHVLAHAQPRVRSGGCVAGGSSAVVLWRASGEGRRGQRHRTQIENRSNFDQSDYPEEGKRCLIKLSADPTAVTS